MPASVLVILIGWLIALAIFFGFIVLLRYLQHREHMAMISSGMHPTSLRRQRRNGGMLRAGLIIAMVGLALTIGLYPIGFILPPIYATIPLHLGPWLLPGLIPLGVGAALIKRSRLVVLSHLRLIGDCTSASDAKAQAIMYLNN
ncbi:MAG: hypothetical protein E6I97_28210 [Chloroflexi bacterium]|nr:MAG: hypothetical protein E6I97_28210 [Chloroflexota bacterium]